jgi:hypothetical protein
MHHDTTKQEIIDSLNRKINRTKLFLQSKKQKIFVYYRHITLETDSKVLIDETVDFCKMYRKKYNNKFMILSLIMIDAKSDKEKLHTYMLKLQKHNTKYIKFNFVFKRNDDDWALNEVANIRWKNVFKLYNIGL